MNRHCVAAPIVFCLFLGATVFSQVINATLTGTVSDASGALIPGVEIKTANVDTGIVSTVLTNETGTYRFVSLQPGRYQVNVSLLGFRPQAVQLALGTSQQIRQNFILEVGGVTQEVEVSVAPDQLLSSVVSSVGNVLPQTQVASLPLVTRNVMDFATIVAGVQAGGSAGGGRRETTFAGIPAGGSGNVGLQMDGASMNTGRYLTGLASNNTINPDMVAEVRVVVAAVDPEGRGSAQVQIRTRSGTNQVHGGLTWNVRNSALNANTWANNRQRISPTWYNRHQYTASVGGPIIQNKTFFFGMFDGQTGLQKETVETTVLTDTARLGIFRFFPGVNNGNAETTASGSGTTRVVPVVDLAGNPLDWTRIGATGPMQSFNVFGDALNPGDPNRRQMDRTGFMSKLITNMPRPNAFNGGDGLNTAVHRWVRRVVIGGAIGQGADPDAYRRKQFHVKIDHHFNSYHTLTGTWNQEYRYSNNDALSPWPNGWSGENTADPKVMTLQLTSTLSPTLLNEFRYGYRLTRFQSSPSYLVHKEAWDFLPKINGVPLLQNPVLFGSRSAFDNSAHMIGNADFGHRDPMSTYTDTLSWTRGVHVIKTGVEFRFASAASWVPGNLTPLVTGGAGDIAVQGIDRVPGLLPSNITLAQNLLLSLSGSVESIRQKFETREPSDTRFRDFNDTFFDPDNPDSPRRGAVKNWHQNEINFFIKDDWKVTPNLTLNLGMRYDLMRVPFLLSASGKSWTPGFLGGNQAIFGYSGRSIGDWMSGGGRQKGDLTEVVLIGKDTQYPEQGIWPSDRNNFGPAVGFAWAPTWWGRDKNTIRGGYQIAYQLPGNSLSFVDSDARGTPGFVSDVNDRGSGIFRDFSNMVIPVPLTQVPYEVVPITQRSQNVSLFAPDYTTPYVQTFTLGVMRSLASNLTLDVRYIGTRGMKIHSGFNLNDVDFRNNGVLQALQITRAGGDAPLFDQMLKGLNIGSGVVGVAVSGSEALRRHASFRTLIANGDFVAVARLLNTTNIGTVQPQGQVVAGGTLRSSGSFPENFFVVNPQFANIAYRTNTDTSNYHSLQTQLTLRPWHGVTYQGSYTWSRNLGVAGGTDGTGLQDLMNRKADYTLIASSRTHDFRGYGTFELPFGPGKLLARGSSGWLARITEGWNIGTIFNISSGVPLNVGGIRTLYAATGTVDIAGAFPGKGKVMWPLKAGDAFGNFFEQQYQRVPDPACNGLASNLTAWCTITALADVNGNIVLRNAGPGQRGTLGQRTIVGPGLWTLDANLQKRIRIDESKNLTMRVDASNLFNHPIPGNPNLNINSGTFGEITSKTGNRTLAAQIHLEF
jgi:hypothetical protein